MSFRLGYGKKLGVLTYKGSWNAETNSPSLTSSVGEKNEYYIVSVAGTTNLNGVTEWDVGDWAIFNGSFWEQIDNQNLNKNIQSLDGGMASEDNLASEENFSGEIIDGGGA